jgi:uncharacterized circularly permuted ATP-grasp superfamily protein
MPDVAADTAPYPVGEFFDEAFGHGGRARPPYSDVLARLATADLDGLTEQIRKLLADRGVAFGGEDGHPFVVDPVPRVITAEEWEGLAAGLWQRVRALELFLDDAYGEQRVVREGIVPERVVTGSAYFEEDLRGLRPAGGARIALAGLDVVRDGEGRFRVLEDNARTPSGLAYAMAASDAVAGVLGIERPVAQAREELCRALRRVMEASAPHVEGELVLLTDGEENSAWYEHRTLAEVAGLVLATPRDVRRRGRTVELADGRRVRALYRRTEEDRVRRADGALTWLADLVLEPLAAGELGLANWPGNGVADDKEVYAYVDDLVRFYLGEEPTVRSVRTYDLADARQVEEVLDRLPELVVKPRAGQGGQGVVVGPAASHRDVEEARAAVRADPAAWIAQETVSLSTHPTVVDGRLAPRHVDLRPFTFHDGVDVVVPTGGLTRVALAEGSMVVNSSQDGGAKATWVG